MYRVSTYILLYFVVMLLQIFIFNNITISIMLTPLIYIAFLLFLPLRTSQFATLFIGAFLGITADVVTGMAGVNTIATLFVAYIRLYVIAAFLRVEIINGKLNDPTGQSVKRISRMSRSLCFGTLILIHHAIFFMVEMLSFTSPSFLFSRIAFSSVVTTLFTIVLYDLFVHLFSKRSS